MHLVLSIARVSAISALSIILSHPESIRAVVSSDSFPKPKSDKTALAGDPEIEAKLKTLPPGADINLARAALLKAKSSQASQKAK